MLVLFILANASSFLLAQSPADSSKKKEKKSKFKAYDAVINEKAESKSGVFTTHFVEGKLYYEIPQNKFEKEFVWVYQISKTQSGYNFHAYPVGDRVVRWQRVDDRVLLRNVEYTKRAEKGTPEALGVSYAMVEAIIAGFDIVTFSPDSLPIIEVTSLFVDDTPEFSPKNALKAKSIDKKRSLISSVKAFPRNLETRVLATYKVDPYNPFASPAKPVKRKGTDLSLGSVTVEMHHSMVELPERPMRPRKFDERVGYFDTQFEQYSDEEVQVEEVRFIKRWRLEKKNPDAKLSEPVQPIVYYIGRETPKKWRKYVKEGIEVWQEAFEAAGFKNAIIGKYAPTEEEDSGWDAEDARYSTVRWLAVKTRNAFGPHVADPRTGEILEADIRFFHNHLSTYRNWFFVQSSAHAGKKYQKLPYSDEMMGRFVRRVTAHEVGHTLGLRHNYLASFAYTIEQLRSKEWTKKYGIAASIMEYARTNYVAQPGDEADFLSKIGPYDNFAVEWGYREFKRTKNYEKDKKHLDKIAERQLSDPLVRFSGGREDGLTGRADPTSQTEDLGNDVLEATRLGLLNLERVMSYIVEGVSEAGEDYRLLEEIYGFVVGQLRTEMAHVANYVGGVKVNRLLHGQGEKLFDPLPAEKQKAAVAFLLKNVFETPDWLVRDDVVSRIGVHNTQNRILTIQEYLLRLLINEERAERMTDIEAAGIVNYTVSDLLDQLTAGLFAELGEESVKIAVFRRNVQRAFVKKMIEQFDGKKDPNNDLQAIARLTAHDLKVRLSETVAADKTTKAHLFDLSRLIEIAENKTR